MDLPLNPGEKYALIAVDVAATFAGVHDLGGGKFAIRGGRLRLPEHWKEWIGSIETQSIEASTLILLAKMRSQNPTHLDGESKTLIDRVKRLFFCLMASDRFGVVGDAPILTGGRDEREITVKRSERTGLSVFPLHGIRAGRVEENDLARFASLARNLDTLMTERPGMRRVKRAFQTFWGGFAEADLGERIHQFVRVVSDGVAKAWGGGDFRERCAVLVESNGEEICRQLYLMRNNAEHYNEPDKGIEPILAERKSLERAYLRAHQAEALARHCIARFVDTPALWPHFADDGQVDSFWKNVPAGAWGDPLDLEAAVAEFDAKSIPDEER